MVGDIIEPLMLPLLRPLPRLDGQEADGREHHRAASAPCALGGRFLGPGKQLVGANGPPSATYPYSLPLSEHLESWTLVQEFPAKTHMFTRLSPDKATVNPYKCSLCAVPHSYMVHGK